MVEVRAAVLAPAHAILVPADGVKTRHCDGVLPARLQSRRYPRFFGGPAPRLVGSGFFGFLVAAPLLGAVRRPGAPSAVDLRCLAASMLARSAVSKSRDAAPVRDSWVNVRPEALASMRAVSVSR